LFAAPGGGWWYYKDRRMYKKLISQAVKEKVGISKVVDSLKEAYDYIIGWCGEYNNSA